MFLRERQEQGVGSYLSSRRLPYTVHGTHTNRRTVETQGLTATWFRFSQTLSKIARKRTQPHRIQPPPLFALSSYTYLGKLSLQIHQHIAVDTDRSNDKSLSNDTNRG